MQKWVGEKMRCRGTLIFIRLLFFLHFKNNNCLQYNRIKVNLLIMCEEDGVGSMSVKHCLIVFNSGWTWQHFALFTRLYALMAQGLSGTRTWCYEPKKQHCVKLFNFSLLMFCVPALESKWQPIHKPVQVWTFIMCPCSTGQLWYADDSGAEPSCFDWQEKTPVWRREDEGLDQRAVESWITLTSFTNRGKKAAGVREWAILLALDPGVVCGGTQKAWPTASTNCTSPGSTPLREHPSFWPDTPFITIFICHVPNQLHE